MIKWVAEDGTVQGAAWNDEYCLFIDFVNGIRVDQSPNCDSIRRGDTPDEESDQSEWLEFDDIIAEWGLSWGPAENGEEYLEDVELLSFESFAGFVKALFELEDEGDDDE